MMSPEIRPPPPRKHCLFFIPISHISQSTSRSYPPKAQFRSIHGAIVSQ